MSSSNTTSPLQEQLDEMGNKAPEPIRARLEEGIAEVRESGQARGLGIGVHAPDFTLPDALGQ